LLRAGWLALRLVCSHPIQRNDESYAEAMQGAAWLLPVAGILFSASKA